MNKIKNVIQILLFVIVILMFCFVLFGCRQEDTAVSDDSKDRAGQQTVSMDNANTISASEISIPKYELPGQAITGSETGADTIITLNGSSIIVDGEGTEVVGSVATIVAEGSYLVTGKLADGQIIVDTEDENKVEIILNGADITCSNSSAIYVKNAPKKAVLYLQDGSVNLIEDGSDYDISGYDSETDPPSAAIYSQDDLKIDGNGELYVNANYNKGIFSKDDLEIEGGKIYIEAVDDGIRGKDSVEMTGGTVNIKAGGDGLRTSNETDEGKGYINISSGEIYIEAELDGIQAVTDLTITDGTVAVISGGGSTNASSTSDSWGNWGGYGGNGGGGSMGEKKENGGDATLSESEETASAKGIKTGDSLTITGGVISVNSSDDAIHSNDSIEISAGDIYIDSGDDGIHADSSLIVKGGSIDINQSYEGLEALSIDISDGEISIIACDDGLNAAGGSDNSAMDRPGENSFASVDNGMITVDGGYIVVNASGDGVDSNGNIEMNDGTLIVYGPSDNANGSLDYNGSFTLNSGWLLAAGSSGMAQSVSSSSQAVLAFTINMSADTLLQIADADNNEVLSFASPKNYSCLLFSCPELSPGVSYTVSSGGSHLGDCVDGIYSDGSYSGGDILGSMTAD